MIFRYSVEQEKLEIPEFQDKLGNLTRNMNNFNGIFQDFFVKKKKIR